MRTDPMALARRVCGVVVMCLLAAAPVGCDSSSGKPGYSPKGEERLHEVWAMYQAYIGARKRPPARLTDLEPYEPANIYGYAALNNGDLVMLWGGSAGSGPAVLAYEKDAPQQGGAVLLQDGTVKHMTAEEFQAAPKAGKR
jgi:hypothetical protein